MRWGKIIKPAPQDNPQLTTEQISTVATFVQDFYCWETGQANDTWSSTHAEKAAMFAQRYEDDIYPIIRYRNISQTVLLGGILCDKDFSDRYDSCLRNACLKKSDFEGTTLKPDGFRTIMTELGKFFTSDGTINAPPAPWINIFSNSGHLLKKLSKPNASLQWLQSVSSDAFNILAGRMVQLSQASGCSLSFDTDIHTACIQLASAIALEKVGGSETDKQSFLEWYIGELPQKENIKLPKTIEQSLADFDELLRRKLPNAEVQRKLISNQLRNITNALSHTIGDDPPFML